MAPAAPMLIRISGYKSSHMEFYSDMKTKSQEQGKVNLMVYGPMEPKSLESSFREG